MATCHLPGILERLQVSHPTPSGPSDSSGRSKVWNFTSSVFMTVGDADKPWHPQFFSAVTFEFCV